MPALQTDNTVSATCGTCGTLHRETMIFTQGIKPGDPVMFVCRECPGWRAHKVLTINDAAPVTHMLAGAISDWDDYLRNDRRIT